MKKLKKTQKALTILLLGTMVVALAACSKSTPTESTSSPSTRATSTDSASAAPEASAKEPVTLEILWPSTFPVPGIQKTEVAEEIRKQTGITMDIISGDEEKTKVMLASGDLPDILVVEAGKYGKNLIDGKQVIALDDLLNTNGKDILANMKVSLDSAKAAFNTDKYYFMPHRVNPKEDPSVAYAPGVANYLRWDYYKELGKPKIKTTDDLIQVLSDMMKKHPTNKDGKKSYGISGWNDWGLWPFYIPNMNESGWTEIAGIIDGDGKPHNRYAPDSAFWTGLDFWYKAKKAGIVDPDSFTQKYDAYVAKYKSGQLLDIFANWQAGDGNVALAAIDKNAGYEPVPKDYMYNSAITIEGTAEGDLGKSQFITVKSKHADRAMDLLNFLRTEAGGRLVFSGIKGTHWDNAGGAPELLDSYLAERKANPDSINKTGIGLYDKLAGWSPLSLDPVDHAPFDLGSTAKGLLSGGTDADKDFSQTYGGVYPGDAINKLSEAGKMKTVPYKLKVATLAPAPDDLKKIEDQTEQYLIKNYTKAIFAKTDADFKDQIKKMQDDIQKMGYDKDTEWYLKSWQASYDLKNKK
jgi:putative aldouronate transport system substrate-binding protein